MRIWLLSFEINYYEIHSEFQTHWGLMLILSFIATAVGTDHSVQCIDFQNFRSCWPSMMRWSINENLRVSSRNQTSIPWFVSRILSNRESFILIDSLWVWITREKCVGFESCWQRLRLSAHGDFCIRVCELWSTMCGHWTVIASLNAWKAGLPRTIRNSACSLSFFAGVKPLCCVLVDF